METLGNRMKENYEDRYRMKLTRRTPVIMRLDGKAFHTLTKNCNKPFDKHISNCMEKSALFLCKQIQGAKCAYIQSDEVSILITDFDDLNTNAWFDYNVQKMVSVAASMMSVEFNDFWRVRLGRDMSPDGFFDCRVFNIPKEEVANYFVWRQKDWFRNSLSMCARFFFTQRELHRKNSDQMHEMIHNRGGCWNKLDTRWKNGIFIYKKDSEWIIDFENIFTENRASVEQYLRIGE